MALSTNDTSCQKFVPCNWYQSSLISNNLNLLCFYVFAMQSSFLSPLVSFAAVWSCHSTISHDSEVHDSWFCTLPTSRMFGRSFAVNNVKKSDNIRPFHNSRKIKSVFPVSRIKGNAFHIQKIKTMSISHCTETYFGKSRNMKKHKPPFHTSREKGHSRITKHTLPP